MYKYMIVYSYTKENLKQGVGRAFITSTAPLDNEDDICDVENRIKEDQSFKHCLITGVTLVNIETKPTINEEELKLSVESALRWVHKHLNPHQQLIITLDGVKIVSDDLFIPVEVEDDSI